MSVSDFLLYGTVSEPLLFLQAIADTPSFIFLWVGDGVGLEQGRQCLKKVYMVLRPDYALFLPFLKLFWQSFWFDHWLNILVIFSSLYYCSGGSVGVKIYAG